MRWLRSLSVFALMLLSIEFLDEFVFGSREAAWPLMRTDLGLSYAQVGLLLSLPVLFSSLVEPLIGILGDVWQRRNLILGGGLVFSLALMIISTSQGFWGLLLAFSLLYPASGAFVSLSQAAMMDAEPHRHEQNMARWTLAGSLGVVAGPLFLGGVTFLGWSWRLLFIVFAALAVLMLLLARRFTFLNGSKDSSAAEINTLSFREAVRGALVAFTRKEVWRWLVLLELGDLMLDVLLGFLALYFVDVVGQTPAQAGVAVAIWTGAGLFGDFLLIPLLERIPGLRYLRMSAFLVLLIYPAFLLIPSLLAKLILLALLGFLNAGWYAIPKGHLFSALPGRSGTALAVKNLFGLLGGLLPLAIGLVAQYGGLQLAVWLLLLAPLAYLVGLPRFHSRMEAGNLP